jgi:hypothetical protein
MITLATVVGVLTAIAPLATAGGLGVSLGLVMASLVAVRRPCWVVLFLTAFMPFEYFLLKFVPQTSDLAYLVLQSVGELVIYSTFAIVVFQKVLIRGAFLRRTPIDAPLVAFVVVAILSVVVNQSPMLSALLNLRTLFRYTFLFYLVVNLDFGPKQVDVLVRITLFVGLVQIILGGLQVVSGGALNEFLMPKQVDLEVLGQSRQFRVTEGTREVGSVYGTLGDTIFFGLFMLAVLAVYVGRLKKFRVRSALFLVAILAMLGFSYARAAVFGALLMLLIAYRSRSGLQRVFLLFFMMLPAGVIGLLLLLGSFDEASFVDPRRSSTGIFGNITGIFSRDYVQRAQGQRLGSLLEVVPTVWVNRPILGYGLDEETAIEGLNESQRSFLSAPLDERDARRFEDVYWVAMLAYCGLAGVGALMFLLYRLYSSAWKIYKKAHDSMTRQMAFVVICTSGIAPFLLFFYRALKYRIYGFYFWLLPALMFALYAQERKRGERAVVTADDSS